ncbi:MAG: DNA integrity scanning protein DisA nucleotide-binding domain protein [Thermoguttaceae bacterium]
MEPKELSVTISQTLVEHVSTIARSCGAGAVFVYVDALAGGSLALPGDLGCNVFYVTKSEAEEEAQKRQGRTFLRVPDVSLARLDQMKIAVFFALSRGLISPDDVIVCLTGLPASGRLDTILVTQVGREFEMFSTPGDGDQYPAHIRPEVVERVIDIASELGNEGREGKPVGALFVVGDSEQIRAVSRQLILNPFRGYEEQERNILDRGLEETVKELSTLDGAFILRGDGVMEACGTFLKVAGDEEHQLPQGLGARHSAAAAITAVTDSFAITVSESTGTVTVFRGGKIVTELEKPRSLIHPRRLGTRG